MKKKELVKKIKLTKRQLLKRVVYIVLRDAGGNIACMVKDYVWLSNIESIFTFFYELDLAYDEFGTVWDFDKKSLEEKYGHIYCREEDKHMIYGYTERDFVQSVYDKIQNIKKKVGEDSLGYLELDALGLSIKNRLEKIDIEIESSDETLR